MTKATLKKQILAEFEELTGSGFYADALGEINLNKIKELISTVIDRTAESLIGALELEETHGNAYQHEANARIKKNIQSWSEGEV